MKGASKNGTNTARKEGNKGTELVEWVLSGSNNNVSEVIAGQAKQKTNATRRNRGIFLQSLRIIRMGRSNKT
jgi:hypothetical protein